MKFDIERLERIAASCRAWAEILRGVAAVLMGVIWLIFWIWLFGYLKGAW